MNNLKSVTFSSTAVKAIECKAAIMYFAFFAVADHWNRSERGRRKEVRRASAGKSSGK